MFKSVLTPRWGTADAEAKGPSLMGVQGYQRFPLSKPVVGQNVALNAVPALSVSLCVCLCLCLSLCASATSMVFKYGVNEALYK